MIWLSSHLISKQNLGIAFALLSVEHQKSLRQRLLYIVSFWFSPDKFWNPLWPKNKLWNARVTPHRSWCPVVICCYFSGRHTAPQWKWPAAPLFIEQYIVAPEQYSSDVAHNVRYHDLKGGAHKKVNQNQNMFIKVIPRNEVCAEIEIVLRQLRWVFLCVLFDLFRIKSVQLHFLVEYSIAEWHSVTRNPRQIIIHRPTIDTDGDKRSVSR